MKGAQGWFNYFPRLSLIASVRRNWKLFHHGWLKKRVASQARISQEKNDTRLAIEMPMNFYPGLMSGRQRRYSLLKNQPCPVCFVLLCFLPPPPSLFSRNEGKESVLHFIARCKFRNAKHRELVLPMLGVTVALSSCSQLFLICYETKAAEARELVAERIQATP